MWLHSPAHDGDGRGPITERSPDAFNAHTRLAIAMVFAAELKQPADTVANPMAENGVALSGHAAYRGHAFI